MAEQTTDTELLALFREPATKEKAFTEIVKKYQERLYWHIRRMLVDHEDSNDVLQNVFIRVWNALSGFREDAQLYTWLYRIATNECLTFIEQQKKRASVSLNDLESGLSNKIRADKDFDAKNWNGNCNWQFSNYLKNKELCLCLGIMMKCRMRK